MTVTYEQWEAEVPLAIKGDTVWRVEAYRLGMFLHDLAWVDYDKLLKHRKTRGTADQLYRASSNISSNVVEGYSRDTGKARSTVYEYALGSARETRDWYFKARHVLAERVVNHRMEVCTQV